MKRNIPLKRISKIVFVFLSVAIPPVAGAYPKFGISLESCTPRSGWSALRESINPRQFWIEQNVDIEMAIENWEWGCAEWCGGADEALIVLSQKKFFESMLRCLPVTVMMCRKHGGHC